MRPIQVVLAIIVVAVTVLPVGVPAQEAIFLIRHPEQTGDSDPVLTEAGHRRAAALAHRLKDAEITAIYVTDTTRTRQTAGPIAAALGIVPTVVLPQDIEGLVTRVRAEQPNGRVLLVNHALNIPRILKAMGHPGDVQVALDDFEPLLVIVPRAGASPIVLFLRL